MSGFGNFQPVVVVACCYGLNLCIWQRESAMAYSNLKETDVWKQFKKRWPWHAERQEPGAGYDAGKPDVLLMDKHGTAGLVELKAPNRWKLRPSQWIWHERWVKAGGRSCIVTCEMYEGERRPSWYVCEITEYILRDRKLKKGGIHDGHIVEHICTILKLKG
jgi:hypothetical protein